MSTQLEEKLNRILSEKKEKIIPENIRAGISIFDVEGSFETLDTSDATATPSDVLDGKIAYSANDTRIEGTYIPLDTSDATADETQILEGETAYVNGEKIQGTMPNNGILSYEPTEEEQNIPTGYTSGGNIGAVDITKLSEYEACLTLANSIETTEIYTDTTATADDIKEGKIAYSNGERLVGTLKTTDAKITSGFYLFYSNSRIDYVDDILKLCDNVTNASYMFYNCSELKSLDLSNFDASQVTNMIYMFSGCTTLSTLNLSGFDTSRVTNMSYMFYNCVQLQTLDLSNFDTSRVTNMSYMFNSCRTLSTLDLSNFDTSRVTNMSYMFNSCRTLSTLDLSNFGTNKVTHMVNMFSDCRTLSTLDLSNFDASNVVFITNMFTNVINLQNLTSFKNLGKGYTSKSNNYNSYKLDLSSSTLLTHESLMSVINNLYDLNLTYDVANGGTLYTQKLVLGTTNLGKLTSEEIAVATNKGWTIS